MSWINGVLGIIQTLQGIGAQRGANQAGNGNMAGANSSMAQIQALMPFLNDLISQQSGNYKQLAGGVRDLGLKAINAGREYDPAADTAASMRSFDIGARESLNSDLANTRLPMQLRGLTGSSEDATQTTGLLSRRANARGKYNADLVAGEKGKSMAMTSAAAGVGSPILQQFNPQSAIQGAAGILGGSAQMQSNMAQQNFANAGSINPFGALQGLNWDWLRTRRPTTTGRA